VNPEAAAILEALRVLPSNATLKAIAEEAGLRLDETEDLLAALAVVGFVDTVSLGRWRAHALLRDKANRHALDSLVALLRGIPSDPTSRQPEPVAPPPAPLPVKLPPKPLQLAAAAHQLGVHPDTLDVWAKQGLVPFTWTAGGRRRFEVESILDALARKAA